MKALNNVGILGLTLLGNAAHAQAPETVPSLGSVTVIAAPTPYRQFDKVEITGSAILAKEAREALPIQVLTQRDIAQSGATDLSSFVQRLPVMQNFSETGMATGTSEGGPETAAIHGRQSGTLVLLNGRRLPYYGSQTIVGERAVVDLNFIPLSAVEKIEILTDGASTRYGSDAVAGVVNVITRSRVRGLALSAETSLPSLQGGARKGANLSWGSGVVEQDGYSLRTHFSLSHQQAVLAGWRPVAREGARSFDMQGARYWLVGPHYSDYSAPGRNYRDATGKQRNTYQDANGQCEPGWYELAVGQCTRNAQAPITLYPETRKQQLYVQGERLLDNRWLLFADLMLGRHTQNMTPSGTYYTFDQPSADGSRTYLMDGVPWGLLQQRYDNDLRHFVLGLKGEAAGWDFSLGASHGTHRVERNYTGGIVSAGYDNVRVLPQEIDLHPDQYSDTTRTQFARYAYAGNFWMDTGKTTLDAAHLLASRTLVDTDAGPVRLGWGLDTRQESAWYQSHTPDRPNWDGTRRVWATYAELLWPMHERLEVTTALRHDRYSDFGNITTGKLGWKFQLVERAWLRGSLGTGFRAPTLGQLVPKTTSYIGTSDYTLTVMGNPDLKPERSRQWTLGAQWEPSRQWSLGADVWNLDVRDTFGVLSLEQIVNTTELQNRYRDPNNSGNFIVPNMNVGQSLARGMDYYLRWRQPFDHGRWQLAVRGTMMFKSMQDAGQGMVSNLGVYTAASQTFVPRHRLSVIPSFERNGWTYSAALHHHSAHKETLMLSAMNDGPALSYTHRVASFTTLDLAVQGRWDKHWDFGASVLNVTNRMPALTFNSVNALIGVDTRAGDYYGRRLQLKIQYRF